MLKVKNNYFLCKMHSLLIKIPMDLKYRGLKNTSSLGFETLLLIHAAPQISSPYLHLLLLLSKLKSSGSFVYIHCFSYSSLAIDSQIYISLRFPCFREAFPVTFQNKHPAKQVQIWSNYHLLKSCPSFHFSYHQRCSHSLPQARNHKVIFLVLVSHSHTPLISNSHQFKIRISLIFPDFSKSYHIL